MSARSQLASLNNLECSKIVTRSYRRTADGALHRIDVIGAAGGYVDGRDEDTPVTRNGRPLRRTMRELKGSWSTGEFGGLLAEEAAVIAGGGVRLNATEAGESVVIAYHVPANESAWDLNINKRAWRPGYDAAITIRMGRVATIARSLDDAAPYGSLWQITWRVDYERRTVGERDINVPVRARYETCRRGSGRCDVNEIVFSDYREFRSRSTITFASASLTE